MATKQVKSSPFAKATGDKQKSKITKKTAKIVAAKPRAKKKVEIKATKAVPKIINKYEKEVLPAKVAVKKQTGLTQKIYDVDGSTKGTITLPETIFGAKVNAPLMAQAIRVYLANQREGGASTKTRGEVQGSTRKIYKQKGTGRARHGAIRAPIFVGGGIVFGPRPKDYSLSLPQTMRRKAVASALTSKLQEGSVKVVSEVTSLPLKTKEFATLFGNLSCDEKTLMLLGKEELGSSRAMRNLAHVSTLPATDVHTYGVLTNKYVVMTKKAVHELEALYKKS